METAKYNGWTNYATWRIHLEIIGDIEFETHQTAEDLKELVESVVLDPIPNNFRREHWLAYDYASAFIDEVNFYEIAEHVNENQNGKAQTFKVVFDVGTRRQSETIDALGEAEAYAKACDFARANFLGHWAIRSLSIQG